MCLTEIQMLFLWVHISRRFEGSYLNHLQEKVIQEKCCCCYSYWPENIKSHYEPSKHLELFTQRYSFAFQETLPLVALGCRASNIWRWAMCKLYVFSSIGNEGQDSSVGIATRIGLEGPGIESRWGARFSATRPGRPWGLPSLLYNGYRVFPGGKAAGAWRWPSTPI